MQLFRRMGCVDLLFALWLADHCRPRVILVGSEGRLVGLVTVKDVLRHEASEHHQKSRGHSRNISTDSANGWHDSWIADEDGADVVDNDRGHGLEIVLEEAYGWFIVMSARVNNVVNGWRGRRGNQTEAQAYEYELDAQSDR